LPYRYAIFRTAGDAQLYRFILQRVLSEARKRAESLEMAHKALFTRTHVLLAWTGDKSDFEDLSNLPHGPYTTLQGTNCSLVADASTVIIERWGLGLELKEWLGTLSSLTLIRCLESDIPHFSRRGYMQNREIGMPLLAKKKKYTSKALLPEHDFKAMAELGGMANSFALLSGFRDTKRITLLTKQSLKTGANFLPATINLLVLDTPPGPDGVSDIKEWNIPGGLVAGVLTSGIRRKADQPRIIVKGSSMVDPISWGLASEACQKHGVLFELEGAY
jgi:hypothetical protein